MAEGFHPSPMSPAQQFAHLAPPSMFPSTPVCLAPTGPPSSQAPVASYSQADSALAALSDFSSDSVQSVVQFLKKHGLKEAEKAFLREVSTKGVEVRSEPVAESGAGSEESKLRDQQQDLQKLISAHQTKDANPDAYFGAYQSLVDFVDKCLDNVKPELGALLYPSFAHMYLELVCSGHRQAADSFLRRFGPTQETFWQEDIRRLNNVRTVEHLESSELLDTFNKNQFTVRISKDSFTVLKPFILQHSFMQQILRRHTVLEPIDAQPRSKEAVNAVSGGLLGETGKTANKTRIYYGIFREEPTPSSVSSVADEEDDGSGKKKKVKGKDAGKDKKKGDPNAPAINRIPLPEWSEKMKRERMSAQKEIQKRVRLSADLLPSVCMYTVLNANEGVCSATMTEDSSLVALGLGSSTVQLHSAAQMKLKPMKPAPQLEGLDPEADDIHEQILDENKAASMVDFVGHCGPVYGVSFSPDRRLLLSSSQDSSVRLWSMETWTNLVVYRLGAFPIWDVSFSPRGCYFASGGADRLGLVWVTDRHQPLRVLAGHYSDVNCIRFHPNCNYVATGSDDRSVRVWDVLNGQCVRQFNGHKGGVQSLEWSPDGRLVASGDSEGGVMLWDVMQGRLTQRAEPSNLGRPLAAAVKTLCWSREGELVAAGGLDNKVRLFNPRAPGASAELRPETPAGTARSDFQTFEISSFPTKSTPVLHLHFTRRNLLLAMGSYDQ